ncbi:MAG: cation transporter [Clostridia bacterium]|nr:cation transporter [Clostridia bacterium]
MSTQKSGAKTLLWSVLMSSPGPLIIGLGLIGGRSSTQIADFFRRSAELMAIIMSYLVFRMTASGGCGEERKRLLERRTNIFVGAMMCLGGAVMILLALTGGNAEKGNVLPGLAIAVMGVIANAVFWRRYARLNKEEPNAILLVQSRLYRAKTLVDGCVVIALLSVFVTPESNVSYWLDLAGSLIVAFYLIWCGISTIREAGHEPPLSI